MLKVLSLVSLLSPYNQRARANMLLCVAVLFCSTLLMSGPSLALKADSVHLPISYLEERILVPVHISGVGERYFILDTAAGRSVISSDLLDELDLAPEDIDQAEVQGATGAITLKVATLSGLSLGGCFRMMSVL